MSEGTENVGDGRNQHTGRGNVARSMLSDEARVSSKHLVKGKLEDISTGLIHHSLIFRIPTHDVIS